MRIESGRVETGRRRDRDWRHYDHDPRSSTVEINSGRNIRLENVKAFWLT